MKFQLINLIKILFKNFEGIEKGMDVFYKKVCVCFQNFFVYVFFLKSIKMHTNYLQLS